jgi:hypothetical protein
MTHQPTKIAVSSIILDETIYPRKGIAHHFLDTIFSDIDSLILYAGVHIKLNDYHRLLSKTFPYAVYYQIDADIIKIYAILDCRRNPNQTIEELKQRRTIMKEF